MSPPPGAGAGSSGAAVALPPAALAGIGAIACFLLGGLCLSIWLLLRANARLRRKLREAAGAAPAGATVPLLRAEERAENGLTEGAPRFCASSAVQ